MERLKGILQAKGVTLCALVDHSGEAEKVGMKMPPTKLLILGSPKMVVVLLASYIPARRAARVNPIAALRES